MQYWLRMRRITSELVECTGHGHTQRVQMPAAFVTAAFHAGDEVDVEIEGTAPDDLRVVRFIPELRPGDLDGAWVDRGGSGSS